MPKNILTSVSVVLEVSPRGVRMDKPNSAKLYPTDFISLYGSWMKPMYLTKSTTYLS